MFVIHGMKATSRSEEFRLRFEPLRRHLMPYEFSCDSRGHVHVDALDNGSLLQYLYVRGLINVDYCLPRMVAYASLEKVLSNSVSSSSESGVRRRGAQNPDLCVPGELALSSCSDLP
jgi:hypothetical protein